jgi:4-aminobutyrate aminotransferase/(S)-3-amino-2-methylpropionate transaminase
MKSWPSSSGDALHTSTFLSHPLGCAAALATIGELERGEFCERSKNLGRFAITEISSWRGSLGVVSNVRGRGLMLGIELEKGQETGLAFNVARQLLRRGLIVLPCGPSGNVLSISPPLTITEAQLKWALETLKGVLHSVA